MVVSSTLKHPISVIVFPGNPKAPANDASSNLLTLLTYTSMEDLITPDLSPKNPTFKLVDDNSLVSLSIYNPDNDT